MLRRALRSAWTWRIARAEQLKGVLRAPGLFPGQNAFTRDRQARRYGVANVWIDEETAAARRASRNPGPRKRKKRTAEGEETVKEKPQVSAHELRGTRGAVRKWRDGTLRPPGREGHIRMLDSGKLIGRRRIAMVNKYGKPKRIPRKIRLGKVENRRQERNLQKRMELDPELKAKVEKAKIPSDTGAARRHREKRLDLQRMNKMERRRESEEKAAAAYFSTPLKSEQRKVMTLFGEIDVTAAKKYRELKVARRKLLLESSEQQTLQIEAGSRDAEATAENDESDVLERLRQRALKLQDQEESRQKLLSSKLEKQNVLQLEAQTSKRKLVSGKEKVMELDDPAKVREKAEKMIEDGRKLLKLVSDTSEKPVQIEEVNEIKPGKKAKLKEQKDQVNVQTLKEIDIKPGKLREEKDQANFQGSNDMKLGKKPKLKEEEGEQKCKTASSSKAEKPKTSSHSAAAKVEVALVDDDAADEDDEKWQWALDSTKPIDDSYQGSRLAKVLGANALLGFPRLTKAKKTKPSRKSKTVIPEEEDIVLGPQLYADEELANLPTVFQPEERVLSLERQIIDKTLEEYHNILQSELSEPRKKPWIRRVMKLDKDDITSKRYQSPEERIASGTVNPAELSSKAKFRLIQPSRELMLYIDSQLLGRRRLDEWRKAGYNVKLPAPLDNVPFHKGDDKHRIHQSIFRNRHVFVAGAKVASSIPPAELPEIAFAGRTNAGKSKLINALTRRYGTARTSPIPGKTESLNFYVLGTKLCIVDTPGYSFMYGNQEHVQDLRQLTKDYITIRDELRRVCLLIDAQWGLRQKDQDFIDFLESVNRNYQVVLTKTDKVSPLDLGRRVTEVQEAIKDCRHHVEPVMMVSAKSGAGIGKLRMSIANLL